MKIQRKDLNIIKICGSFKALMNMEKNIRIIIEIKKTSSKELLKTRGLITNRQRPKTAKGTVFITIEDETGSLNLIVSKSEKTFIGSSKGKKASKTAKGKSERLPTVLQLIFIECNPDC